LQLWEAIAAKRRPIVIDTASRALALAMVIR